MKLYLTTAIALGLAAPAFACETLPIQNSNATQRADADCPLPEAQGGKSMLVYCLHRRNSLFFVEH
jgi:hypothetical protein